MFDAFCLHAKVFNQKVCGTFLFLHFQENNKKYIKNVKTKTTKMI